MRVRSSPEQPVEVGAILIRNCIFRRSLSCVVVGEGEVKAVAKVGLSDQNGSTHIAVVCVARLARTNEPSFVRIRLQPRRVRNLAFCGRFRGQDVRAPQRSFVLSAPFAGTPILQIQVTGLIGMCHSSSEKSLEIKRPQLGGDSWGRNSAVEGRHARIIFQRPVRSYVTF